MRRPRTDSLPLRDASRARAILVVGLVMAGAPLAAQETARLVTLGGETITATAWRSSDGESLELTLPNASTRRVLLDELESMLLPTGAAAPAAPAAPGRVWLRSGLESAAQLTGGSEAHAQLRLAFGDPLELRWQHVRALRLLALEGDDARGFETALAAPPATDDVLFARARTGKSTRLSLRVLGVEGADLVVDFRGERRNMPLDQVLGIVFGTDNGTAPPPLPLPSIRVETVAAGIWHGRLEALDERGLRLRLAEGASLTIDASAMRSFAVRSSRVQWLSATEPKAIQRTAALDLEPFFLRDSAPGGEGLLLGGRRFARGICMAPRTRVTWALSPGSFAWLEASIGIDDRSTGPADATFRVAIDGTVVFERSHVRSGVVEGLRLPLNDGKELTLEVDFGEHFDLGDHCVFAAARLVKS
ncbi:MAG: NPCBM/NEW2 domain-containing protein [Planctomycetes bacterium]|nr:NPCBM/NEW2 domain-containing protein [Planctomycetota bacterium]